MESSTSQTTEGFDAKARDAEWEDLSVARVRELTERSRRIGWRAALDEVAAERPFFARRMHNFPLGNWHLLRLLPPESRVLDVGCGFGSLALGLAQHFRDVTGIDALPSRVAYAAMRADEDGRAARFVQGSGLALPFPVGAFDLVTMNGVLEWAGLYADGAPRQLQLDMLGEARRVLSPEGTLAIAIENRFAMETLAGMPDTHTGLRLAPALPRAAAALLSRVVRRRDFRTFLYDGAGYRRLLHEAGFADARAFDLVSSYNDYDFVVEPTDADTYRLLWRAGLVRTFYARAGRARKLVAERWPAALGRVGYAYLLLAGRHVPTLLDPTHALWLRAAGVGLASGGSRFACQGTRVGSLVLVPHDAGRVLGAVELSIEGRADGLATLAAPTAEQLGLRDARLVAEWQENGVTIRCHRRVG